MPKCVTVPQFAVGTGKVMSAAFPVWPPVPLDAPVVPPCVAVHAVVDGPTCTRAYDPPVTSVPPPASEGAAV
jgi:hypothetical protein